MTKRRDNVRRSMAAYERSWHRCTTHKPVSIEWVNPSTARMTADCVQCGKRQVSDANVREILDLDHVLSQAERDDFARLFMESGLLGGARA